MEDGEVSSKGSLTYLLDSVRTCTSISQSSESTNKDVIPVIQNIAIFEREEISWWTNVL